ncbi:MAG: hypothetical protein QOD56_2613 [Gammaproteobacteria bacterium]|jgi:hypothetical protein|nr:hypothetical protein [Acetobacteraceae bacterium]MEA3151674.1 hypothetical protein [Gammaproteobacteria bacterium]
MPPCRPLPYIPPSMPGELLSSWLRRIAAEYGVDLRHITAHFDLSVCRAWEIDRALPADDVRRIAAALRTDPVEIREMVHFAETRVLHPTSAPLQVCAKCRAGHRAATRLPVTIRAWFEFWQIECEHCGTPFSPSGRPNLTRCNPAREEPVWFESLRPAARVGARLLANFACRPLMPGFSPLTILQLLSMRFDAIRFAKGRVSRLGVDELFASRRLIELFVPGLSELWRDNLIPAPWTSDKPVRLVTARTILLAGMATFLSNKEKGCDLLNRVSPCVSHTGFGSLLTSLTSSAGWA